MVTDVFIVHATEDKESVAQPLAEVLRRRGFVVWYDQFVIGVGDSISARIDEGLAQCRFAVVVLSPTFFSKNWTKWELAGLTRRQIERGQKLILPIYHNITATEITRFSPPLADLMGIATSAGISAVADAIGQILAKNRSPS